MFICLCFCPLLAFADSSSVDDTNWGVQPTLRPAQAITPEASEDVWNQQRNNIIDEKYGCDTSPGFLNRDNINPNESDYGYGGFDGVD